MNLPPLILASASPRRSRLLGQLAVEFQVVLSEISEVEHSHLTPHELSQLNAYHKARAVARQHADALVLGADTLVCLGNVLFGKPANRAEAETMLGRLQGRTHQVVTGVCLIHLRTHRRETFAESTDVEFRELGPEQIKRYLDLINPLDKAGAYAIQEYGELIIERIDGSFSNVVGLPLERLESVLMRWGSRPTQGIG